MGLLDVIDDRHAKMTVALAALDSSGPDCSENQYLKEAMELANADQKATLDKKDVDGFAKQEQKLILSDLFCRLQLDQSLKLLSEKPDVCDVGDPPVAIDQLKDLAEDQQKFTKWRQQQTDPTLLYQIAQWAEKLVKKIYEHMKTCVLSAIQETQLLIQGKNAVDETLEELKNVKESLRGLIDRLLHTARILKVELTSFKEQIAEMTKHTGIIDLENRTQALLIRSKMTGLKTHFRSLQEAFIQTMKEEVQKKNTEYDQIVETHKKQLQEAATAGGLLEQFKTGFESAAAVLMGGGSVILGLACVAVLFFAGILTGGLAIALCVGGVALGAGGIAALSYLYACNAKDHHDDFKTKLEEVTIQMQRLSNLMMTLVNALNLVQLSFSLIERQIYHILGTLTEKLMEYPNTKVVEEWTDDDWKDQAKIGELAKQIKGADAWGTPIEMILGIAEQPKVSILELTSKVNQAIEDLSEFECRVSEAAKDYLGSSEKPAQSHIAQ